ncbi:MAG: sterol desaturase family protein [Bdellovibrionia bacterium]
MSGWLEKLNILFQFDEPTSRLYHVNILSSLALILGLALYLQIKNPKNLKILLKKWLFDKRYWWNSSTKQDYFIYIFNGLLKSLLLVPLLDISFEISRFTVRSLMSMTPGGDTLDLPTSSLYIGIFSLAVFVWDDFLRFIHHYLMHKIPLLWEFHKTHHNARVLTPITLFRAHPIESVIAVLRNSLSLGVASGIFVYTFGSTMTVWTILGVNGIGFIFNLVGANLRHSHIPLGFGIFENIIISPIQHQIHHSRKTEHYDKNFGVTLAIWDKLFGTHVYSKNIGPLKVGINEPFKKSNYRLLVDPVRAAYQHFKLQRPGT